MQRYLSGVLLTAGYAAASDQATAAELTRYMQWIAKTGRHVTDQSEMNARALSFEKSMKHIDAHNALFQEGKATYEQAPVYWLADMLDHERPIETTMKTPEPLDWSEATVAATTADAPEAGREIRKGTAPTAYDWTATAVSLNRDMGACSYGRYAQATISLIESQWMIEAYVNTGTESIDTSWSYTGFSSKVTSADRDGTPMDWMQFSEQQIIDCTHDKSIPDAVNNSVEANRVQTISNSGCASAGGSVYQSAWYFKKATGSRLMTLEEYPFTGVDGTCSYDIAKSTYMWLNSVTYHTPTLLDNLNQLISETTVATSVLACTDFNSLSGTGIYDTECATGVESGAHIVGYDTATTDHYFLVKYGSSSWGDQGIGKVRMAADASGPVMSPGFANIQKGPFISVTFGTATTNVMSAASVGLTSPVCPMSLVEPTWYPVTPGSMTIGADANSASTAVSSAENLPVFTYGETLPSDCTVDDFGQYVVAYQTSDSKDPIISVGNSLSTTPNLHIQLGFSALNNNLGYRTLTIALVSNTNSAVVFGMYQVSVLLWAPQCEETTFWTAATPTSQFIDLYSGAPVKTVDLTLAISDPDLSECSSQVTYAIASKSAGLDDGSFNPTLTLASLAIDAPVEADRPKMASGGAQSLTLSATTLKGTALPTATLNMIWAEKVCRRAVSLTSPTSTASNPAAQVYVENADNQYFTWALPTSDPSQCAAQWTYAIFDSNSVSVGDQTSFFSASSPVTAGADTFWFVKQSTIADNDEGKMYTTSMCPTTADNGDVLGQPQTVGECSAVQMTVTTTECNAPTTVTPTAIAGPSTYRTGVIRPDETTTDFTFTPWTIAPSVCLSQGNMLYELVADADISFAFLNPTAMINIVQICSGCERKFELTGSTTDTLAAWTALYKTTVTFTVYIKTSNDLRIATTDTYTTMSMYIADPACDAVTITQTATTSHIDYELNGEGADFVFQVPAPASESVAGCPLSVRRNYDVTQSTIYPSLVELTAASVYAAGGDTTFVTIKTPTSSTINTDDVQNAMGDHSFELEWLAQDGSALSPAAKYTLTVRFGHVDCKTTSPTPMTATYTTTGTAISNPYDVDSHKLDRNEAYSPSFKTIDVTPTWCKLIVSYTSTGITKSTDGVTFTEIYVMGTSTPTAVGFSTTGIDSTAVTAGTTSQAYGRHSWAVAFADFAGTNMLTQNVPIALTSTYCETIANYDASWLGVAGDAERAYNIGSDTLPTTHTSTAPTSTGAVSGGCVTYMSAAIPVELATFAAFDASTGILSWTKITDESKYGLHQIPVAAETTNAVSFGTAAELPVYMSKPACEQGTAVGVTNTFQITSVASVTESVTADLTTFTMLTNTFTMTDNTCLQRYTATIASYLTDTEGDLTTMYTATTITVSFSAQTVVVSLPYSGGPWMKHGQHIVTVTAYSTMNVALYEADSTSVFAVNTITLKKYATECETTDTVPGAGLVTAVPAATTGAYYRIGTTHAGLVWTRFTLSVTTCNVLYSIVVPTEFQSYVSQTGLRQATVSIPTGTEAGGAYVITVKATNVNAGTAQTKEYTLDFRVSDPDCEPPATVTPLLDSGVAHNTHALFAAQDFVMWSFSILPAKCLPLMDYASTVSGTGESSGAVVSWNSQRVFKFPWSLTVAAATGGPYTIAVTPSTWEGTTLSDTANVWSRSVTISDPCPISAWTADNTGISYVKNSGDIVINLRDRITTDPVDCNRITGYDGESISYSNGVNTLFHVARLTPDEVVLRGTASTTANAAFTAQQVTDGLSYEVTATPFKVGGLFSEIIQQTIVITVTDDCPSGPTLASITTPITAQNPDVIFYVGRQASSNSINSYIPQWTTSPTTCLLTYSVASGTTSAVTFNADLMAIQVTTGQSANAVAFAFPVTAAWNGVALDPVQTSTYTFTLTADPCEPPTILEANENKVASFDLTLRGNEDAKFSFDSLVYEPSHCKPAAIVGTRDDTASSIPIGDTGSTASDETAAISWSTTALTHEKWMLNVGYTTMPLDKKGKWVWVVKGQTDVSNAAIVASGAQVTVTLNVIDPCDTATDPTLEDRQVYHYTGLERTTDIVWAGFTFTESVCNDGTIPFPTCYAGSVDSDLPTAAWTWDKYTDWQAPKWVIETEDTTLNGETYTLTYYSQYDSLTTDTQTVTLTIYGKCEALDYVVTTAPTMEEAVAYRLGGPAATVTIPAFTVVPADCVQTLVVTIPSALATVCTVSGANQLAFEGKKGDVPIGAYEITAQAKTAAGFLVPGAILTIKVSIENQQATSGALQEIVTTALATSAALFGGGVAGASSLSGGLAPAASGSATAGTGSDSFVDGGETASASTEVSDVTGESSADANDIGGEETSGDNFDEEPNTI